jgi:hypothetical protein
VYVLLDSHESRVKIGHTSNPIAARCRQISHTLGRDLVFIARVGETREDEARLHERFVTAMSDSGEWFSIDDDSLEAWLAEIDTTGTFRQWSSDTTGSPAQSPPEAQASEQELPIEKPNSTERTRADADDSRLSPPDDFPEELRPHARVVLPILQRIAEQHGCPPVWPLRVGKLLMRSRHKPLVEVAHELDEWAVDPPRKIKDVVGTYQTFLGNKRDLQGVEQLDGDGLPANTRSPRPSADRSATVGRTRSRRGAEYDEHIIWDHQ